MPNGTMRKHRSRQRQTDRYRFCYIPFQQSRLFRRGRKRRRLRQQRCLEGCLATSHVSLVDETRRSYRHHGRQRGAPWRIATFHHATLRVAPATQRVNRWGNPCGSRAFSRDDPHDIAAKSLRDMKRNNADNKMALVMTDEQFEQGALSVYVGFENGAWLQVRRTSELNDEQHLERGSHRRRGSVS